MSKKHVFERKKHVFSTKNGPINLGLMSIKQLNKERQPLVQSADQTGRQCDSLVSDVPLFNSNHSTLMKYQLRFDF